MSSFGKDPRDAAGIATFGSGTMSQRDRFRKQQVTQARASRAAGGGGAYWRDHFRLPLDHSRFGRFIPGAYMQPLVDVESGTIQNTTLEYVVYNEHYNATVKRGAICSGGPWVGIDWKKIEPCLGCQSRQAFYDANRGNRKAKPPISLMAHYVFNWLDYSPRLKLPREGSSNPHTQQPYYDWVPVSPSDPRYLSQQFESRTGIVVPWALTEAHKDYLVLYADRVIKRDCGTCGTAGSIVLVDKVCGNVRCHARVYDPNNTSMTPEQIEKLEATPFSCPTCQETHYIEDIVACQCCQANGAQPRRANLFDVDFELMAVPEGNTNKTNIQILQRSGPRPINGSVAPLDLLTKYKPPTLEQQAELWNIPLSSGVHTPGGTPAQQMLPPVQQQSYAQPGPAYAPQPGFQPMMQPMQPQTMPQMAPQMAPQGQPQYYPQGYPGPGGGGYRGQ